MDEMPSSEFRKHYATLSKPTVVTVSGHAIGIWQPIDLMKRILLPVDQGGISGLVELPFESTFSSRPFTPVPKVRKG
jgi:hypothetical protein